MSDVECLKKELDTWKKAENTISDAYLRIRRLVGAYDTKPGGEDRFEVTENRIRELLKIEEKYNKIVEVIDGQL